MNLRQRLSGCARACGAVALRPLVRQPSSPWLPIAVYGPVAAACVLGDVLFGELPAWAWLALPTAGVFLWTLVEYVLHSRFFHDPPRGFRWVSLSHGSHHDAPEDPNRIVAKLSFSLPLAVGFFAVLSLAFWSVAWGALVFAGLAAGYLSYEVIHYSIHRVARVRKMIRPLASHHLHHHYADASRCYGVTTRLWDWVFRTGRREEAAERAPMAPAPRPSVNFPS